MAKKLIVGKEYLFEGGRVTYLGENPNIEGGYIQGDIAEYYFRNENSNPHFPEDSVGFCLSHLEENLEEIDE